jgi:hypothetical protein
MIGLSVSFCIRDIVDGKMPLSGVEKIIGGTKALNDADWENVISRYQQVYWKKFPLRAAALCRWLVKAGKIEQPRCNPEGSQAVPCIGQGHWVANESEVIWNDYRFE